MSDELVDERTLGCVEALLLAADGPLTLDRMQSLLSGAGEPDRKTVRTAVQALQSHYEGRAAALVEVGSGWRLQVREDYAELVGKLWEERPPRLSRALMETLALICYRQPISRGEIEEVRGVSVSSSIIKTLIEREWVHIVGYREVPGRPALFGTTKHFLDDFNLKRLQDLPSLPEMRDLDSLDEAVQRLTGEAGANDAVAGPDAEAKSESDPESAKAKSESDPESDPESAGESAGEESSRDDGAAAGPDERPDAQPPTDEPLH